MSDLINLYNPNSPEYREWQRQSSTGDTRTYDQWLNAHMSANPTSASAATYFTRPDNSYETDYNDFLWNSGSNFQNEYNRVRAAGDTRTYSQWAADHFRENPDAAAQFGYVDPFSAEYQKANAAQDLSDPLQQGYVDLLTQIAEGRFGSGASGTGGGGGVASVNTNYTLPLIAAQNPIAAQQIVASIVQNIPNVTTEDIEAWLTEGVPDVVWRSIEPYVPVEFQDLDATELMDQIRDIGGVQDERLAGIGRVSDERISGIEDVNARRLQTVDAQRQAIAKAQEDALADIRRNRVIGGFVGDSSFDVGNIARVLASAGMDTALAEGNARTQGAADLATGRLQNTALDAEGRLANQLLGYESGVQAGHVGLDTNRFNLQTRTNVDLQNAQNALQRAIAESQGWLDADKISASNALNTQQFNASQGQQASMFNTENRRAVDMFNAQNEFDKLRFNATQQQNASTANAGNALQASMFNSDLAFKTDAYNTDRQYQDIQYRNNLAQSQAAAGAAAANRAYQQERQALNDRINAYNQLYQLQTDSVMGPS